MICVITSLILMYAFDWISCDETTTTGTDGISVTVPNDACGSSVMFRMTFALFVFHILILLLILPRNECATVIHDSGWSLKFLLIIGLFIGLFWVPIEFFQVWSEISRYGSIFFLLIQTLYILVGAYTFNDFMIRTKAEDESWRNMVMMIYTLILQVSSIAIMVGGFFWFNTSSKEKEGETCGDNMFHLIATICMNILVCAIRFRPDSSIFTSAMVNLWLCFLMWSALASEEDSCNSLFNSSTATFF